MRYRKLGEEGPLVSAMGLGTLLLSISGRPPENQAESVIDVALELGITLFDTSDAWCLDDRDPMHGLKLLGNALRGQEQPHVISCKVGYQRPGGAWTVDARPEALIAATEASLEALRRESIEVLQLAAPDRRIPIEESVGALLRMKEKGYAQHIGLCNATIEQVERARKVTSICCVQNRWSPSDRTAETTGLIDYCRDHGIAFVGFSPFGGTVGAPTIGNLGDIGREARKRRVTPYQLLVGWMIARATNTFVLVGARRIESISDTITGANLQLSAEDVEAIGQALSG